MADKEPKPPRTVMSAMDTAPDHWTPEANSRAYNDIIPIREPLAMTLLRVGARVPQVSRATFFSGRNTLYS